MCTSWCSHPPAAAQEGGHGASAFVVIHRQLSYTQTHISRCIEHVTAVDGKQDTERERERESMRAAKQEWQQRQMEAFRNRKQVEGERAGPAPLPSPLDPPPVYSPGKHTPCIVTEHALPALPALHVLMCATGRGWLLTEGQDYPAAVLHLRHIPPCFLNHPGVKHMTLQ